jgi:hypothetical protein
MPTQGVPQVPTYNRQSRSVKYSADLSITFHLDYWLIPETEL